MILADLAPTWSRSRTPARRLHAPRAALQGRDVGPLPAVNRGKRSIVLGPQGAAGRDAMLRMATHADVVVESFRPGAWTKLGVGYSGTVGTQPEHHHVLGQRLRPDRSLRAARRSRPRLPRDRRCPRDGRPSRRRADDARCPVADLAGRRAVGRHGDPRRAGPPDRTGGGAHLDIR